VPARSSGARRAAPGSSSEIPTRPAKKSRLPLILGAAGGGVLILLVLVVALATGKKSPPREEAAPAPVAVAPTPKPVPKLAPPKEDVEAKMKREMEEERKKFLEAEKTKNEERIRRDAEEKARADADAKAKAEEAVAAKKLEESQKKEAAAAFLARRSGRKSESQKALEEARRTLEEDRKAEAARQKDVTERLKTQKLSLKLKNGMKLDNVIVQAITRDEIKLAFTFEGATAEQVFPTEFVDDRSYVDLMKAVYKDGGAAGWYEMGRQLVLRKLWKDAQAAFQECVKKDASMQPRVPDLTRILNNEAAFKGSARRIGADQLFITYDFSDAGMAQDFAVRQQGGTLAAENGELKLSAKGTALWSLKDVDFERDVEIDLVAVLEEGAGLIVGSFFNWERKGYLAVLNSRTPAGHVLYRCEGAKLDAISTQAEPKIAAGAEVRIRLQAKAGAFRLYVGDQEAGNASEASFAKGWAVLGAAGGNVRLKKLTVQGHVNPAEISKRFAEVEVLVRRALEADLGGKKKPAEVDEDPLTGEDEYFLGIIDPAVRAEFEKARRVFLEAQKKRQFLPAHLTLFDKIVEKAPEFAPGHYWRARARMTFRRPEEAKGDYAKAASLDPGFLEAHLGMAQVAMDDRDLASASGYARKALEAAPGHAEAMALAGYLRFITGDPKGAVSELEVARKLDPSSESVQNLQKNVLNVIKGPQHLGAKHVKEFPHYFVMTDMSPEKTMLYGTRLEAAYKHYAETFKDVFQEDPKRPKPRVAIFNTREAYLTYGELTLSGRQEWTLGYFHPLYKELLLFEDVDQDATLQTLYHEAFHQFMAMMAPKVPFWYNEGIAEYMGGIRVEVAKGQSKITERAKILDGRLKVLKQGLAMALPFEAIMMQTPGQFYSGPVSFKYSQAWSMVHFFYESAGGRHRSRIEAYFKSLRDGADLKAAFQAGFGDAKLDELQKEWLEYVKKMEPAKK
jgi:tetratricopeptide (TPR) repeat protein